MLPGPPTTRREFYPIDVLALYAEVYDKLQTDVPHTVDVTTRLVSETGKEVFAHRGRAQEQRVPGGQGRRFFGYSAQVPLADVRAGPLHAPGRGQGAPQGRAEPCAARC